MDTNRSKSPGRRSPIHKALAQGLSRPRSNSARSRSRGSSMGDIGEDEDASETWSSPGAMSSPEAARATAEAAAVAAGLYRDRTGTFREIRPKHVGQIKKRRRRPGRFAKAWAAIPGWIFPLLFFTAVEFAGVNVFWYLLGIVDGTDPAGGIGLLLVGLVCGALALKMYNIVSENIYEWDSYMRTSVRLDPAIVQHLQSASAPAAGHEPHRGSVIGDMLAARVEGRRGSLSDRLKSGLKQSTGMAAHVLSDGAATVGMGIAHEAERAGFSLHFLRWRYLSRLIAVLAFFGASMYLNALASTVSGWRTPNIRTLDPVTGAETPVRTLPDLGHDLFDAVFGPITAAPAAPAPAPWWGRPKQAAAPAAQVVTEDELFWMKMPDRFIAMLQTPVFVLMLAHPRRLQLIRRFAAIYGYISLLRAVCVATTSLPDASPMCTSQFGSPETGRYKGRPIFPKAFVRAIQVMAEPSEHITCGDMVFSGHTVFFVLGCMLFKTYMTEETCDTPFTRTFPKGSHTFVRVCVYAIATCGIVAIVGTRLHYTLDVVIAIYIAWRAWDSYHERCLSRNKSQANRVIQWLEDDRVLAIDDHAELKARNRTTSFALYGQDKKKVANYVNWLDEGHAPWVDSPCTAKLSMSMQSIPSDISEVDGQLQGRGEATEDNDGTRRQRGDTEIDIWAGKTPSPDPSPPPKQHQGNGGKKGIKVE